MFGKITELQKLKQASQSPDTSYKYQHPLHSSIETIKDSKTFTKNEKCLDPGVIFWWVSNLDDIVLNITTARFSSENSRDEKMGEEQDN